MITDSGAAEFESIKRKESVLHILVKFKYNAIAAGMLLGAVIGATALYGCAEAEFSPSGGESDVENEESEAECDGYILSADGVGIAYVDGEFELTVFIEYLCDCQCRYLESIGVTVEEINVENNFELAPARFGSSLLSDDLTELVQTLERSEITVNYRVIESYVESISFETKYKNSSDHYEGTETLQSDGANGEKKLLYSVFYTGSRESARTLENEELIKAPKDKVVLVGTKKSTVSTGSYAWPTKNVYVTSYYGWRTINGVKGYHYGIDLRAAIGTQIYASDGGEVIYCGTATGYGKLIKIRHDNGDVTYYAHLSAYSVKVGTRVYKGQVIAKSGNTGRVTGPHLHFELRKGGTTRVDPLKYLP